ncbi:MAG TPA: GxxExxY protein [Polyangiaceae bacterium]
MVRLEGLKGLTRAVIGAAIEVHRVLGPGFSEATYERALCAELGVRGIPYEEQAIVVVRYKDLPVGEMRVDVLVADALILELKAVDAHSPVHVAQVLSYLKATGLPLGLLINFNVRVLRDGIRRIVWTHPQTSALSSPSLRLCDEKQSDGVED